MHRQRPFLSFTPGGRAVVRPEAIPLGFLADDQRLHDARLYVESLSAELKGGQYLLRAPPRPR